MIRTVWLSRHIFGLITPSSGAHIHALYSATFTFIFIKNGKARTISSIILLYTTTKIFQFQNLKSPIFDKSCIFFEEIFDSGKIVDLWKIFDFWQNCTFFTKSLIFDKIHNLWQNPWFLAKIGNFDDKSAQIFLSKMKNFALSDSIWVQKKSDDNYFSLLD